MLGRGGIARVAVATGVARNTIMVGMAELDGSANEFIAAVPLAPAGATRRSGGGRKAATDKDPTLVLSKSRGSSACSRLQRRGGLLP